MNPIFKAAGRHPVLACATWIAICWAIGLIAGDLLVAAGYAL